jgi:tetratricopeptide (TPR) repeat protein
MLNNMVSHCYAIADLSKAKEFSDLSLKMYKEIDSDLDILTQVYIRRAPVLEDIGLYEDSFKELSELVKLIEGNVDSYYLAIIYNYLGALKRRMKSFQESLDYHQKAYDIFAGLDQNDKNNLLGMATSLNDIGSSYEKLKEFELALEKKLMSLEIRERILPKDHPDIAKSYNNLGNSYNNVHDYEQALICEEKALEIRTRILPEIHPDIAKIYNNFGSTYRMMKNYEKAISHYDIAIDINRQSKGVAATNLVFSLNKKASVYFDMKNYEEALRLYEEAYNLTKTKYFNDAVEMCEKMLDIYNILNDNEKISLCVERLISLYTKLNKLAKVELLKNKYGK